MQAVSYVSPKMLSLCAVVATQSRQYSTEQMKWFRKDKSYLWVRSELEKPNPIANAMQKITHFYRANRSTFEAALCVALSRSCIVHCTRSMARRNLRLAGLSLELAGTAARIAQSISALLH